MTIEAIPFGSGQREQTANPIQGLLKRIHQAIVREKTGGKKEDGVQEAAYLGIYLSRKRLIGDLSEEDILSKFSILEAAGVNMRQLHRTYEYLVQSKTIFPWVDIDFQVATLERFMPDMLPKALKSSEK